MPEVWVAVGQPGPGVIGGAAKRVMPLHVPVVTPHWPAFARAGFMVAIVFDHPSVHHGWPDAPMVIMCGVPLTGRTIGYSEIVFRLPGLSTPILSTLLLFSVTQISRPLAVMP